MKYIVTGGAGFIGHNVVHQLEAMGHTCYVLDSGTDYGFVPEEELRYLLTERKKKFKSQVHTIDIRNAGAVELFFRGCLNVDAVIHLASFPRQKIVTQDPVWGAEVMGTALVNLLEQTKKNNIPKFVYISSSMVYGDFEDDVQENEVCQPQGQYAIMKYMGEQLVRDYSINQHAFDHVIIRPSAVYGKLDVEDRVISKFILTAMRGGELQVNGCNEILDFSHVEDVAAGIELAATLSAANNKTYNITRSSDQTCTLEQAARLIIDLVGSGTIAINDRESGYPTRGRLCIDRAVKDLGYAPAIDIEQGFQRYYNWFKKSTYWQKNLNRGD
jgi:nucleoside-diphosphate-sugar epimerase